MLGISASTKFAQKSFSASLKLPYPLLSDFPNFRTIRAYDVSQKVGETGRVFARQSFFLIDKEGIVRGRWVVKEKEPGAVVASDELFSSEPILQAARKLVGK